LSVLKALSRDARKTRSFFGRYNNKLSFGQNHVLVVSTDILFPNGSRILELCAHAEQFSAGPTLLEEPGPCRS
jgi:hypothetical protein